MIDLRNAAGRACIAVLCLPAALVVACDDDAASPVATATTAGQTATPSPAPTPTPTHTQIAARLEYAGEFERAIDEYAAAAASSTGDEKDAAVLAQARLLVRTGELGEARGLLDGMYAVATPAQDAGWGRFLHAFVLQQVGDNAAALDAYNRYVAAGGALAPYAEAEQALLLAPSGAVGEAEMAANAALANLSGSFRNSVMFRMGQSLEDRAPAQAIAWYERSRQAGGDAASALARMGALRRRLGDPAWVDDYRAVVMSFPAGGPASQVLAELDSAGVPVSDYARGLVHYRHFENAAAQEAFTRAIAAGDNVAASTYYLAAIDERYGNAVSAVTRYAQVPALDAASPLADDALWWRGRLLETTEDYAAAAEVYATLVERFPASELAEDARFHRGLALYRGGQPAEAAAAWDANVNTARGDDRARAIFWRGKAQRAAGEDAASDATLASVIAEFPGNFYALRAEVLLRRNVRDVNTVLLRAPQSNWSAVTAAISNALGPPATATLPASVTATPAPSPTATPDPRPRVVGDPRWEIAASLELVGMHRESQETYADVIDDHAGDPLALAATTERMSLADSGMTARAASRLLSLLAARGIVLSGDAMRTVLTAAYPPAFADLVDAAAADRDVPPLLLLALVRQESYFDPQAGSHAGALGLTQVIEPTGRAIASSLGVNDFELADLFRPQLSLRFGADYLHSQLRAFDNNFYHALAAYNGGPGTASNAIDSAGDDLDLFVEDLEFDETRLYVKLVSENYARYRQLYEGLDRPSLPR